MYDYDLLVLGSGPSGQKAAIAASKLGRCVAIVDRREAIAGAIGLALPGDLVLVAGKGHEKSQVIGSQVLPFDDVAVAREALDRRRTNSGVV